MDSSGGHGQDGKRPTGMEKTLIADVVVGMLSGDSCRRRALAHRPNSGRGKCAQRRTKDCRPSAPITNLAVLVMDVFALLYSGHNCRRSHSANG